MENKIRVFSEYSYIENTINSKLDGNAGIIKKVKSVKIMLLDLLKNASIDPDLFNILSRYFNLNNERPQEVLNEQKVRYLYLLSYQLIKLLNMQSSLPKERLLLRLFIFLNFNKDQIIEYYKNKIDSEVENNPLKREDILNSYENESSYLRKKDIFYTTDNYSLGKVINNHVSILRRQLNQQSEQAIFNDHSRYSNLPRLINITGTSSMMMYGFNMLINTGLLEIHPPFKIFYVILSKMIRRSNGKKFSPNTLKARFNTYSLETLYKMAEYLEILREYNEHKIKIIMNAK